MGFLDHLPEKKTFALTRALQTYTEVSRAQPGVLCGAVRELQQCMAPLMTIKGDDVMEASLLGPKEEEPGPSPTPEGEAALPGMGDRTSGAAGPAPYK